MKVPRNIPVLATILVLWGFFLYWPAMHAPFQYDSVALIDILSRVKVFDAVQIWLWDPTRFLSHATFVLNYLVDGTDVTGFRVINFFLHLVMTGLVLRFYLLAASPWIRREQRDRSVFPVAFAVLLFLVHPIQTSTVSYVVQRSTIMSGIFFMASLIFFVLYRQKGGRIYFALSLMIALLGTMTKPNIATLPLVIIMTDRILFPELSRGKKDWFRWAPYFVIAALVPIFLSVFFSSAFNVENILSATRETEKFSRGEYFLTQLPVLITYLRLVLVPVGLNMDYDFPIAAGFWNLPTLSSALIILLLLLVAAKAARHHRLIAFGILWFFLTLSIESSIFPIQDVIFEHRLYLPMVGLALVFPQSLSLLIRDRRWMTTVMVMIILIFSCLTFQRNHLWSDQIAFLKDVVGKSPNKPRTHFSLGRAYAALGRHDEAIASYNTALTLLPGYAEVYNDRANAYGALRQWDNALIDYETAIRHKPDNADIYINRAVTYIQMGQQDKAMADLARALDISPRKANAYAARAQIHESRGAFQDALNDYTKALNLSVRNEKFYNNRGLVLRKLGRYRDALKDFDQAIHINPVWANAYNNRGLVYFDMNDPRTAKKNFLRALEIDPENEAARNNLKTIQKFLDE